MVKALAYYNHCITYKSIELRAATIIYSKYIFKSLEKIMLKIEGRVQALGYLNMCGKEYERSEVRASGFTRHAPPATLHNYIQELYAHTIYKFLVHEQQPTPRSPDGMEVCGALGRSEAVVSYFVGNSPSFPNGGQYAR